MNIAHHPPILYDDALSIVSKEEGPPKQDFGYRQCSSENFFLKVTGKIWTGHQAMLRSSYLKEESCAKFVDMMFHGLCWYLEEIT